MKRKHIEQNDKGAVFLMLAPALVFLATVCAVLFLWEDHRVPAAETEITKEQTDVLAAQPEGKISEEEAVLENMTLKEKVAQLFMVTPEALTGVDVAAAAGETTRAAFEERPVGGIIYFRDNLQAKSQTTEMLSNMQKISIDRLGIPIFLGVDEEGGRVTKIAGYSDFGVDNVGPMGALGDSKAAENAGKTISAYLTELGFNLNFAPVADVWDNPENTVIGDRAFGTDGSSAAELVSSAVKGFAQGEILTVLKHFPGHGGTVEDSHSDYAYNNKTLEELEASDFLPFRAGIQAGADMVMVGHISLPKVLGDDTLASLSTKAVTELLREDLGFNGVVVTDAMNMGAIVNHYSSGEAAVMALKAGVDLILMPADFEEAYRSVLKAVGDGTLSETRVNESVKRILKLKFKINNKG